MTSKVLVSLRVAASAERAFAAFTREIGQWWQPNMLFAFTPRSPGVVALEPFLGGAFTETLPNGKRFEIGRITAWEPGARLAFTWRQATFRPGQQTEVEVRFEPVGGETRVTVEHRGWDSVPQEHVARHGIPDGAFLQRHRRMVADAAAFLSRGSLRFPGPDKALTLDQTKGAVAKGSALAFAAWAGAIARFLRPWPTGPVGRTRLCALGRIRHAMRAGGRLRRRKYPPAFPRRQRNLTACDAM